MTVALPHADGWRSVGTRPEARVGTTNPVLPGFHPDPSVGSVGSCYHLVTPTVGRPDQRATA